MLQTAAYMPDFADQLREDIAANRVQLPTLPEVALQVREAVESENSTANQVAEIITRDPALTARLLQVANSPSYRGRVAIDNVQMAVARLGVKLVKQLVITLAMKQIFRATSEALDKAFRDLWSDSLEIAAIARVLSYNVDSLEPEQAMLAGLVHNIGALPILTKVDHDFGYETDPVVINRLMAEHAPDLGCEMLRKWDFAEPLLNIPRDCLDLQRSIPEPDYADLVLVARLQHLVSTGRSDRDTCLTRWEDYPAFARIGLETEVTVLESEESADQIAEARSMLGG